MSDTKIPVHNAVEDMQGALRGEPIQPGDEGYETARKVYNAMSDKRPAVIARCVDAAGQFAATYRQVFPDLQVTVEDRAAEGDRVTTRFTSRGTHGGTRGHRPTGRRVEVTGIVISRIAGGKIAEDYTNFDALGMMQQLGVIPAPEPVLPGSGSKQKGAA